MRITHMIHMFNVGCEYYLSDSSGLPICMNGKTILQKRNGNRESHPWTLTNWLKMSGVRYYTRTKLFCVQKNLGK